ncbi:hypothetical protein SAMN03159318_06007, partial [Pseudomonas sp. NFACC42-2]
MAELWARRRISGSPFLVRLRLPVFFPESSTLKSMPKKAMKALLSLN